MPERHTLNFMKAGGETFPSPKKRNIANRLGQTKKYTHNWFGFGVFAQLYSPCSPHPEPFTFFPLSISQCKCLFECFVRILHRRICVLGDLKAFYVATVSQGSTLYLISLAL